MKSKWISSATWCPSGREVNKELSLWQYRACRAPGTIVNSHSPEQIPGPRCDVDSPRALQFPPLQFAVDRPALTADLQAAPRRTAACHASAIWLRLARKRRS